MWRRRYKRRSTNPILVLFRMLLSLTIFLTLLGGGYYAFQYFSGVDPFKIEPKSLILSLTAKRDPKELINILLSQIKLPNQEGNITEVSSHIIPTIKKDIQASSKPKSVIFKFALVADSHNENNLLASALNKAKREGAKFVIGLGDYSEVGTVPELEKVKAEFDKSGVRYYLTAGDHDLWDSRNRQATPTENFSKFFGSPFQSFILENVKLILVYNADNYIGIDQDQLKWLKEQLRNPAEIKLTLVFLHEPLYHPSSTRVMGKVDERVANQAKELISLFKSSGVKEIFAGDIHFFSRYSEPESGLNMTTVGAATLTRNVQNPRFALITIYSDYSYTVDDIEIK